MLAISIFFFYVFIFRYIPKKMDQAEEGSGIYIFEAITFVFTYIMALWCLAKTFFSNPGYVKDFFYSVKLDDGE